MRGEVLPARRRDDERALLAGGFVRAGAGRNASGTLALYRLAPGRAYAYELLCARAGAAAGGDASAAPTAAPTAGAACASLAKGECQVASACQWKATTATCFAAKTANATADDDDGVAATSAVANATVALSNTTAFRVAGGNGTFTSPTTGYPRFDRRPLGNVTGAFGFSMLATIYGLVDESTGGRAGSFSDDDDARSNDDDDKFGAGEVVFQGLVALDADGWVVWYLELENAKTSADPLELMVFDFLPDHGVALLASAEYGKSARTLAGAPGQLVAVDARTGAIAAQTFVECVGDPHQFNGVSHELRVVSTGGAGAKLVTSQYVVKSYAAPVRVPSFSASSTRRRTRRRATTTSSAARSRSGTRRRRARGQLDLFDYFNPVDHAVASSVYSTGEVDCDVRADDWHEPLVEVLDWAHVSSVAAGVEDNWLVTLRNLNAVVSLRRNATANANNNATATNATSSRLMWTLSASCRATLRSRTRTPSSTSRTRSSSCRTATCCCSTTATTAPAASTAATSPTRRSRTRAASRARSCTGSTARRARALVWQFAYPSPLTEAGRSRARRRRSR